MNAYCWFLADGSIAELLTIDFSWRSEELMFVKVYEYHIQEEKIEEYLRIQRFRKKIS